MADYSSSRYPSLPQQSPDDAQAPDIGSQLDPNQLTQVLQGANPINNVSSPPQQPPDQAGRLQAGMADYANMLLQQAKQLSQPDTGFRHSLGGAFMHAAGLSTPREQQLQGVNAQIQALQGATGVENSARQQQQLDYSQQMVQLQRPDGTIVTLPQALMGKLGPAYVRGDATVKAAEIRSSSQIKMIDGMPYVKGDNGFQPVPVSGLQKILIDKETADAANTPQFAGQELPFKQAMGVIKLAQGASGNITTGEGVFRQNKTTGQLGERLGSAPQVAAGAVRAQQNAYWQAKYGVVQSVDTDGNPQYISRLNAPGAATATGAVEMFKGKAGLANYQDALTRIKSSLPVLEDNTQRALVAQTLRAIGTNHDPGIISAFIGNAVSGGLTEQGADLVAATLQGREFIGANRQYAGNFRGSEQLYQRMVANLPGPQNSTALNQKLVDQDIGNTSRIQGSIKKFQGGAKSGGGRQFSVTDPSGKLQSFSSQAALDRFKKLAGIQ